MIIALPSLLVKRFFAALRAAVRPCMIWMDRRAQEGLPVVAGGVTKSKLWRQIFADVTGYPVVCPKSDVEASMGDVMLAGIGTGLLTYEEVKTWQVLDEPLMPDPARHARYDRCFAVYKSVYRAWISFRSILTNLPYMW